MTLRLSIILTATLLTPLGRAETPTRVAIQRLGEGWQLVRNGEPTVVRGAVGLSQLDRLAQSGANAVRVGRVDRSALDQAHRLGLSALVGLPLGKPRRGFDYTDADQLRKQRETIRGQVLALKDHPALLLWTLGNEPTIFTPPEQRARLWQEVNRLADLVHSLDPNHPVIAVVGGEQWRHNLRELDEYCPALDAVGLNAYADMLNLPEDLAAQGWKRPYLVTEFGPRGHWQVTKTAWGARLEDTSSEKASFYRQAYEHAVSNQPQCLGSFVFLWGWKMEKTHTWYGMFLSDNTRTAAVDTMQFLWSGHWPTNRCPKLGPVTLASQTTPGQAQALSGVFSTGDRLKATVVVSDPEQDPVAVEWDLRRDVADDPRVGGDFEPLEPPIEGAVLTSAAHQAVLQLPRQPGRYRVFVYARDGHGGGATANTPILVE